MLNLSCQAGLSRHFLEWTSTLNSYMKHFDEEWARFTMKPLIPHNKWSSNNYDVLGYSSAGLWLQNPIKPQPQNNPHLPKVFIIAVAVNPLFMIIDGMRPFFSFGMIMFLPTTFSAKKTKIKCSIKLLLDWGLLKKITCKLGNSAKFTILTKAASSADCHLVIAKCWTSMNQTHDYTLWRPMKLNFGACSTLVELSLLYSLGEILGEICGIYLNTLGNFSIKYVTIAFF